MHDSQKASSRRTFLTAATGLAIAGPAFTADADEAVQAPTTPDEALALLAAGNQRFVDGKIMAPKVG